MHFFYIDDSHGYKALNLEIEFNVHFCVVLFFFEFRSNRALNLDRSEHRKHRQLTGWLDLKPKSLY